MQKSKVYLTKVDQNWISIHDSQKICKLSKSEMVNSWKYVELLPFSIALLYESCFLKEPLVTEVLDVLGEILGDDLDQGLLYRWTEHLILPILT